MDLVKLRSLTFRYRPDLPELFEGLHLGFEEGRSTGILGPNGVGKTTLLKLILGWLRPEEGTVSVRDRRVLDYTGRERGQLMSLVPQSEHIPFEYSLLEYVLLGRIPYMRTLELPRGEDLKIAEDAIRKVGLDPEDRRPITVLSGGERQLLLLARSLCQQPELLILDEPTSHLDLANKKRISRIVEDLCGGGLTVIMTTHEPDFAVSSADNLVLMGKGGIIASGKTGEVFTPELLSKTYDTGITTAVVEGKKTAFWW